jgi:hypothetical protein
MALGGAGPSVVLCKTCIMLLYVPEQLGVDNSSVGSKWAQCVQSA